MSGLEPPVDVALRNIAVELLEKFKRFVRSIKYLFSRPLPALLTAGLILAFAAAGSYALVSTQQGQDLLQLAEGRWSKIGLFVGLTSLLCFVEHLAFLLVFGSVYFKDEEADVEFLGSFGPLLTCIGAAILSGYLYEDLWTGLGVWLFSFLALFVQMIFPLLVISKIQEHAPEVAAPACGILSALILLPIAMFPAAVGYKIGSTFVLVLAVGAWSLLVFGIANLGFLVGRTGRGFGLAVRWLIGLWLLKCSLVFGWSLYRNYPNLDYVRTVDDSKPVPLPSLGKQYEAWRDQAGDHRPTLLVVAAAGGGIRASYWTSLVLTRLADRVPNLHRQLFAASGVSGGSLGLGLFYSLLESDYLQCSDDAGKREPCVHRFHRQDFLAGPLSATLAGYPANVLLPFFPRRDDALETGWENAWRDAAGTDGASSDVFSSPFSSSEKGLKSRPVLLLNATAAASGERAMSANVHLDDWIQWRTPCHLNMAEEINLPLSAAIGASARFPFVSDPGWIRRPRSRACGQLEAVSDGGFFDNYGAATLLDMLNALDSRKGGAVNLRNDIDLVVVQITNDPSPEMGCLFGNLERDGDKNPDQARGSVTNRCSAPPPPPPDPPGSFGRFIDAIKNRFLPNWGPAVPSASIQRRIAAAPDLLKSSFLGVEPSAYDVLMQARAVNGIVIAEELRKRTCELGGAYYHFGMTTGDPIPLGWSLSKISQDRLKELLSKGDREKRLDRLVEQLNTGEHKGQCGRDELRTSIRFNLGAHKSPTP